jgi:hypothetical protein
VRHTSNTIITIITLASMLVSYLSPGIASALTAPTAPTAPEAPTNETTAPEAPEAPEAPSAPTLTTDPSSSPDSETVATTETAEAETTPQATETTSSHNPAVSPTASLSEDTSSPSSGTTQSNQVGDTLIETGSANNSGQITTVANTNLTTEATTQDDPSVLAANIGNGSDSDNQITASLTNTDTTLQENLALVDNLMELESTTGDNHADKNVGSSTIISGDANVSGTLINAVNTNIDGVAVVEFNIIDDHVGDIILNFEGSCGTGCSATAALTNELNGTDSYNQTDLDFINIQNTFQTNLAYLDNTLVLSADSGYNTADNNTGGDNTIQTGDANVSASVLNFVNNNISGDVIYALVNIFGDLIGDIIFPEEALQFFNLANQDNGSGSTNQIASTTNNESQTFQTNYAEINNTVEANANTGDNEAKKNTGGSATVETGDVSILTQILNFANLNIVGNMWLVLVNEAGNWIGKIMGAESGATMASSAGLEFIVHPNGDVTVVNSGNGSDSQNIGNINQTNQSTTTQTNEAYINNNLQLSANTGGNSTSGNTGGNNSIQTGDANIVANIINFINTNISGDGRLFVTVVNVFGSWVGNFITPGSKKEVVETNSPANNSPASSSPSTNNSAQVIGGPSSNTQSPDPTNNHDNSDGQAPATSGSLVNVAGTLVNKLPSVFSGTSLDNPEAESSLPVPLTATQIKNKISNAKNEMNINLAWLVLAAPPAALGLFIRRRLME